MWATGEWSATIQGQNFGPKQIKGYWAVIRGDDDWKIRMLTENVTPAPAATPSPTATSSSQWHPDPRPDRLEPGRFDSRRLNDILAIASECLNGSSFHRHSGHRSQRYTINGNTTSSAIGAVNSIIQLPKRIARGFKNFQTAAACELAASDSSFQLLINSDHSQKTAKGLILLQNLMRT
jgi:hypothetical protein